jgi:Helicase C-terminal domain/Luciferase-like monooxygenase
MMISLLIFDDDDANAAAANTIAAAEAAGVRQIWMNQAPWSPDILTTLGAAAKTSTVRLGTFIVPTYPRHPLVLAQIIVKVPYPDLSDRWIKAKKDSDQSWYIWQTVLELEQAYGRSVRSKEDFADTYILDSGFMYFFSRNRGMFAGWFVEALR